MHGHDLVEQPLAGLDQEGGDESVALGWGEALERLGVVPAPELGEVLLQLRRRGREVRPGPEQPIQQVEAGEADRDGLGPRRGRGFLQMGQWRAVLALGHVHQVLDRVAQPFRQPGGDALEQVLHGVGGNGGDQALQRARRRQHDPGGAEQVLGQRQQRPGRHALGCALLQPVAQPPLGGSVELVPAQVPADALQLGALGGRPLGVG